MLFRSALIFYLLPLNIVVTHILHLDILGCIWELLHFEVRLDLGGKEEDFTTLATNALKDACALTNPRVGTLEEVIEIYRSSL